MIIVQKYGGATVSDPTRIKQVASRLSNLQKKGHQVVAVVSAMGKTTNELIELANKVSSNPNRRELDMLLSTGERVSMALLSIALNDLGCEAISFTGSQAGILTNDSHLNAFVEDVRAPRIAEALEKNKIVVLAGFQGVSPRTKEITTLGRGGSDITAIAMAAHLNADRCEILKDVAAVYTADPKVVSDAKPIAKLSYDQLMEFTFWGAKVLHYRSVELAKRRNVSLYIGPAADSELNAEGTTVEIGGPMFESNKILALNCHEKVLELSAKSGSISELTDKLQNFLLKKEIAFPQILGASQNGETSLLLTGPNEILAAIQREIKNSSELGQIKNEFSSIAATCTGSTTNEVPQMILSKLKGAGISVHHVLMSPMSVVAVVAQNQCESALKLLHSLI